MFSKTYAYGIRATLYVAAESIVGRSATLKAITKQSDYSEVFITKILQLPLKSVTIKTIKWLSGVFALSSHSPNKYNLGHTSKAVKGDSIYFDCYLGLIECVASSSCSLRYQLISIFKGLHDIFERLLVVILATKHDFAERLVNNQFIHH